MTTLVLRTVIPSGAAEQFLLKGDLWREVEGPRGCLLKPMLRQGVLTIHVCHSESSAARCSPQQSSKARSEGPRECFLCHVVSGSEAVTFCISNSAAYPNASLSLCHCEQLSRCMAS